MVTRKQLRALAKGRAKLKAMRGKKRVKIITKRKKFLRIRIRDPKKFIAKSFRTHDIGRPKHSKRIAGKTKKKKNWLTQAFLLDQKDFIRKGSKIIPKTAKAKKLITQIQRKHGRVIHVKANKFKTVFIKRKNK